MSYSNDKSTSKDKKESVKRNNVQVNSSIDDFIKEQNVTTTFENIKEQFNTVVDNVQVNSSIPDIIKNENVISAFENKKQCSNVVNDVQVRSSIPDIIKNENVISAFENILESLKSLKINDEYSEKFSREDDLENLKESYKNKKLVLVLGSGVSISYGLPDWNGLLEKLLINVLDPKHKESINSENLAKIYMSFFQNNLFLLRNIHYKYQIDSTLNNSTHISFEDAVRDVLYEKFDENKNSLLFEKIKQMITKLDSIITLNYDDILEKYLKDENIKSIYSGEKTNFGAGVLPIYHVHGYLPKEKTDIKTKIIFSEEDYHQIYSDVYCWSNLIQIDKFTNNTCLFIGTSLSDPNLRRLLDVSKKLRKNESFHYMLKKSEIKINETKMKIAKQVIRLQDILKKLDINEKEVNDCISKICEDLEINENTNEQENIEINNDKDGIIKEIKRLQEEDAYTFGIKIIWTDGHNKFPDLLSEIIDDADNL